MRRLASALVLLLCGCSYLGRNGASKYCTDARGKAIHGPAIPKDSTAADTVKR